MRWKGRERYFSLCDYSNSSTQSSQEMIADGIDPRRGRWGEYLRKKRVEKKTGMMEFQAGTSTVSYRDRKLTLAKQAEYRRSNPTSAAKINKKNKRKAKRS